jgi:hypothetical protein
VTASSGRRIVVAQDTTEINFAGREANRRGLGPAGDGVSAGFFIHPLVAVDSETGAVLGLLDAHIWTRDDAIETAPRRKRAIEDKESIRWLRGVERAAELLTDAASVVVVGDRENDIYSCFARRAAVDLIVRAAQDRALAEDTSLFASAAAWPPYPCRRRCPDIRHRDAAPPALPGRPWPNAERRGRVDAAGQNAVGACISGGGAGHRRLLRFAAGRQETRRADWPEVGVAHPEATCADAIARLSARLPRTPVHSRRCKLLCAARVRRRPAKAGTASLIRRNERLAHSGRSV